MDVKALRTALKNRDSLVEEQGVRIRELERDLARCSERAEVDMVHVVAERNELKALLASTLERLDALSAAVRRSGCST